MLTNELPLPCPIEGCEGMGVMYSLRCDRWIECDECGAKTDVYHHVAHATYAWKSGKVKGNGK